MKIAAVTCSVVLWLSSIFSTAVPLPYLPYVPPTDDRLWGYVFNMFGITAPDLQDVEDKAQVYWDTYRLALGTGYEAFARDMQKVFDNAKTSRKIEMTPALVSSAMLGASYALQNGVVSGGVTPPAQTAQQISEALAAQHIYISAEALPNVAYNNFHLMCLVTAAGEFQIFNIPYNYGECEMRVYATTTENVRYRLYKLVDGAQVFGITRNRYTYDSTTGNVTGWIASSSFGSSSYINDITWWRDMGYQKAATTEVQAQSAAVSEYISQDEVVPFTATSAVVAGVQALSVALPLIDVVPAETVADLPAVQLALGVAVTTPLDEEDLADIKAELEAQYTATYGDTQQFSLDLTSYFPFCIPFDLYKMLLALGADPEAPSIDFPMITGIEKGEIQTVNLHISLEFMDNLMSFIRIGELIFANIGMAMLTAKVIKW